MRLSVIDQGHTGRAALIIRLMGGHVGDAFKTLLYRPGFFGRRFSSILQQSLRGPSPWSPAERELFAAYTSKLNQCPF